MQAMGIEVLYYGGLRHEAGLILRQAHDRGYDLQLVSGDGLGGEDFALIAGPAADGTLFTHAPIPMADPEAALLAKRFASKGFAGLPGPFRAYAVIQVWAQAVERAGTFTPSAVAETLRASQFDTVLGRIGFDLKGDVTGANTFVWYMWKGGEFVPLEENLRTTDRRAWPWRRRQAVPPASADQEADDDADGEEQPVVG